MPPDRLLSAAPLGVAAVAIVVGFTLARPPGSSAASPAVQAGQARAIFLRDCAVCHGPDASGTDRGPTLQGVGKAAIDFWVSTGRMPLVDSGRNARSAYNQSPPGQLLGDPNATPSRHKAVYDTATIDALVDYVASIAPGGLPIPTVQTQGADLSSGGQLYRQQCAACHSWDGTGGALYQREAPSTHAATPTQVAEAIRTGPGQMPAFGTSAIPSTQLNDVVAYVRYLDHPDDRGGWDLWHLGPVAEGGLAIIVGLGAFLIITRWIGERA